jgi:two-component sensor histidine kinase
MVVHQSLARRRPPLSAGATPREVVDGAILASGPHAVVNLWTTLHDTCSELFASLQCNDHLEFDRSAAHNCVLRADIAILVTLIVREAVTNAIKYAHPTRIAGRITVTCSHDPEGVIAIEVTDDGVGLPENFNPETDGANGFRIMRALSQRLEATLAFTSTSLGLHVALRLPLDAHEVPRLPRRETVQPTNSQNPAKQKGRFSMGQGQ